MDDKHKNKCVICEEGNKKLIEAQMEGEEGKLKKVKVCMDCWKNLWGKLLNSKGVKVK